MYQCCQANVFVFRNLNKNVNLLTKEEESINCQTNKVTYKNIQNLIKKKSKNAVWVASNCRDTSGAVKRLHIIQELQKHQIKIDVFGKCGKNKTRLLNKDLYQELSKYKFYFAFENSFSCKDYLTEKLWFNSLYSGLVPIIWGPLKEDLQILLPSNSFIFYDDFSNPIELSKYLQYLLNNDTAYFEYFQWRIDSTCFYPLYGYDKKSSEHWALDENNNLINGFCNLCKKLNDRAHYQRKKVVSSLKKFWFDSERKDCLK